MPENNSITINAKDFTIIMSTLRHAITCFANGRQQNPHCTSYGVVAVMGSTVGLPDESYYVLFNPSHPGMFKVERFENTNDLKSGELVYFYNDKAEAIVQATLGGENSTFTEIE